MDWWVFPLMLIDDDSLDWLFIEIGKTDHACQAQPMY